MTAYVLRGDARHLPLPDGCVDLIVTSPPYFGLRSYTDACDQCGGEGRATRPDSHGVKVCPNGCESTARKRCHYCGESMRWPARKAAEPSSCTACSGTGQQHYPGQIGSEPTPAAWLDALLDCTREWVRVLKPEGNLFVNLGDKYSTGNSGDRNTDLNQRWGNAPGRRVQERSQLRSSRVAGVPPKSLLGLPWRYALGATDQLGLILRAEIIWAKPNGLPESVTDRVRRAHEQVFHFTRSPRYYAAVDEIREPSGEYKTPGRGWIAKHSCPSDGNRIGRQQLATQNPLGKLPGSVWDIPSAPLQVPERLGVDHFAAFPPALVRPIVLGWSPPGVCTACGHGRRPVSAAEPAEARSWALAQRNGRTWHGDGADPKRALGIAAADRQRTITGYACACSGHQAVKVRPGLPRTCAHCKLNLRECADTDDHMCLGWVHVVNGLHHCEPPYWLAEPIGESSSQTRPAIVLDPFGGTGTTALVASCYGRVGVTVDLSADYCRLAQWRVNDPGERARARAMPKPPPVPDGMEPLFTM